MSRIYMSHTNGDRVFSMSLDTKSEDDLKEHIEAFRVYLAGVGYAMQTIEEIFPEE